TAGVTGLVPGRVAAPCPARATGSQPRTTTRPMRIRVSFFIPRSSWDKAHAAQGGRCASEEYSESIWRLSLNVGGTEGRPSLFPLLLDELPVGLQLRFCASLLLGDEVADAV